MNIDRSFYLIVPPRKTDYGSKLSSSRLTGETKLSSNDSPEKLTFTVGIMRNRTKLRPMHYTTLAMYIAKSYNVNCIFFAPRDIDTESKTINAWVVENGEEIRKIVPYPEIVDNKPSLHRSLRRSEHIEAEKNLEAVKNLEKSSIFTRDSLNTTKMKTYKLLKNEGTFKDILIPTYVLNSFQELESYLNNFDNNIIIKPSLGNRGNGVIKLLKEDNKYTVISGNESQIFNINDLEDYYHNILKEKAHIVQPVINSRTLASNPFDIRIHAKKGKDGKFDITYCPRIGKYAHGIVSNIAAGGYSMNIDAFLKDEFGLFAENVKLDLIKIGNSFPEYYQNLHKSKKIFDLGLDIGIHRSTNSYKLYLFEVNIFLNGHSFELHSAKTSMEYYKYLHNIHFQK